MPMNIGKKIKKVRLSKGMTQAELAGEHITRNMLSQIENGSATPSVSTITYIAQRLKMPAGYFLTESENDFLYNKMLCIDALKKAYSDKKYADCIEICKESLHEFDDEIHLLLCECHFRIGQSLFDKAHLVSAHKEFNIALHHAENTVYNSEWIRRSSFVYLDFIGELIPTLRFEPVDSAYSDTDAFISGNMHTYIKAKKLIESDDCEKARALLSQSDFDNGIFSSHIKAKLEMKKNNYSQAFDIMSSVFNGEDIEKYARPILFAIYSDMEICCRERGDFEHAYEYATKKSEIIPEMGK